MVSVVLSIRYPKNSEETGFFGYLILNTTETMIALLNLLPFSNYNVQVRGKTNSGFGAYSQEIVIEVDVTSTILILTGAVGTIYRLRNKIS